MLSMGKASDCQSLHSTAIISGVENVGVVYVYAIKHDEFQILA